MNTFLLIVGLVFAIGLLFSLLNSKPRGKNLTAFGNVAEGHQPRRQTFLADAAIAFRYALVKIGSDARHVAACGVGDIPLGIAHDSVEAAEEGVTVAKFGLHDEGAIGVASGAITAGEFLVPGAAGTVRKLPAAAGTYYIIGRATKDAADTADVEFTPCFPIQRIVE